MHVARMTTWPAVESRVRVLATEAPAQAPAGSPPAAPVETLVEAPIAAPVELPVAASVEEPADAKAPVEPEAIEIDEAVGTDPEPTAHNFGDEFRYDPDAGTDPDLSLFPIPAPPSHPRRLKYRRSQRVHRKNPTILKSSRGHPKWSPRTRSPISPTLNRIIIRIRLRTGKRIWAFLLSPTSQNYTSRAKRAASRANR